MLKRTVKRKLIQFATLGCANSQMVNLLTGKLYKGQWKAVCVPGLNCHSCPAATFACPIGALQAVGASIPFQVSFYVAGFLLAVGVLLGRLVCGFLCPFGLFPELLHKTPLRKVRLYRPLIYVKYAVLVLFVLILPAVWVNYSDTGMPAFCQYICPAGTLEAGFALLATHPELRQSLGWLFAWKFFVLVLVVVASMMNCRFFCKSLCPLGAIYGMLNSISIYRLHVDRDRCVECGLCHRVCPMEVDPLRSPNGTECIRCGECADACPQKAIHLGLAPSRPAADSSRDTMKEA